MQLATTNQPRPLRPGERLVAGRVLVFNQDLLNAFIADEHIESAPSDLSGWTDEEVSELWGAWLNADRRRPFDPRVQEVGEIVCAEKDARDSMSSAYRPSSLPFLMAAE